MIAHRLLSLAFAASLLPAAALAADLAPQPVEPVAPTALPFSWTGFYVGVNAGYGFGGDDRVGVWQAGTNFGSPGTIKGSGFVGGAQAGYNYQMDNFVLGLETDFQGADVNQSVHGAVDGEPAHANSRVNWYGTLRPRVGYAIDHTLLYVTGGLAYANIDYKMNALGTSFSESNTRVGWTAGGGVEQAITDNFTVKLEYGYIGIPKYTAGPPSLYTKSTPGFHTVRLGVNYKF
jgi:outer membrane immunogenic protein